MLDLGCGQGLPFALLIAARAHYLAGSWPATWPAPPTDPELHGIELRSIDVERARLALGERVVVEELDLRDAKLATSDVILLLDVLHYLDREAQEWLLETAMSALAPAGLLILRVGDAAAGFATLAARAIDRTVGLVRDRRVPSLHVRNSSEWIGLLEGMGMTVEAEPMSEGTPFANVLLVARKTRP